MKEIELFENEELITESGGKQIILTTHRVRQVTSDKHLISMMLEKVSSVDVTYQSWFAILIIGIVLFIAGVISNFNGRLDIAYPGIGVGVFLILAYFLTRKHVVTITSDGGTNIIFSTRGMSNEKIFDFVQKLEIAKSKRYK